MTFQSCMMNTQRLTFLIWLMACGKDALDPCVAASYAMLEEVGEQRPEGGLIESHFHSSDSNSQIRTHIYIYVYHMYIYLYFHSYLYFILISLCRCVYPHTCVPRHPCPSQKMWCLDASPQSSTQALGCLHHKGQVYFLIKEEIFTHHWMNMHCTYHQLLSPPFLTLDWQWVWSVILRKPTKPSVHYFKSLVHLCMYV